LKSVPALALVLVASVATAASEPGHVCRSNEIRFSLADHSMMTMNGYVLAAAVPLESTRRLAAELKRAGRAEVTLAWSFGDGQNSGTLALEPPSLARLDVGTTGEQVTLRADGGEWLQPELKQMVKLSPEHSGAAMRWWRLLAGGEVAREQKLGRGGYRLTVGRGDDTDSAEVWLDARGFPSRLVLGDAASERQEYTLRNWKFSRARGHTAFRIAVPAGVEVVELP
jgi:outer membrane lipoprotein-sorting protein